MGHWMTCTATVVAALLLLQERTLDKLSMLGPHELEHHQESKPPGMLDALKSHSLKI